MADSDDLELASEDDPMPGPANGRTGRGANSARPRINIKLRPGSKSRNVTAASTPTASKKQAKAAPTSRDTSTIDRGPMEITSNEHLYDDEDVNKALEFSPMKLPGANSSEPFHRSQKLVWNQKVNLLGEKVVDPLIHSCEKCALPILIYGRMIPCKHVFCFSCAKLTEKSCPRCSQSVVRIEQSALGTVFVCTFGGTKHGVSGCHRTYLSQRDLQSHVAHRHFGTGRDPPPQRSMQPVGPPTPKVPQAPAGVVTSMSFALPQQQQPPVSHDSNSGLIYRSMQQQQQGPPTTGLSHMVLAPHPSMSQPPPQMVQPPPQHMISSHGTTSHVMNSMPPPTAGGPPGMMPVSHGMPPSAMMVQSMPPSAPRGTNLITVQLHDDGDYRVDAGPNSAGGRMQLATTQSENAMSHYPPPMQQYPPQGNLVQSYAVSEHHQMTAMVRPMMTHQMPLGPGQAQMGPGQGQMGPSQGQMGPGQVMVTYSHQMGPPPSAQSQRLGPPPQLQSQAMHGGPPPQNMMSGGPPPQGMMNSVQQAPQQPMPPQGLRGGPPQQPQGLRTGPPQGYAAPPPHLPDQRQQFVGGQQMQWTTGPPPGGPPPPQMQQHMGQRPPQGNIGSSQSMQYYQ